MHGNPYQRASRPPGRAMPGFGSGQGQPPVQPRGYQPPPPRATTQFAPPPSAAQPYESVSEAFLFLFEAIFQYHLFSEKCETLQLKYNL
jgi:hypothetical protein